MKHIIFYSGGIGSYMAAKRVIAKYGKENVILLFSDTRGDDDDFIHHGEDEDLYRFLKETVDFLDCEFVRIADGRNVWSVMNDHVYMSNSRIAHCSEDLKQKIARKWIKEHFKPDECILYLGIDWTEDHRTIGPVKNWHPYEVRFPMVDEPYLSKEEMLQELENDGIETPRLYKLGFVHNNCGGFCVRGGHGHFKHLLQTMPDRYKYHEEQEQILIEKIKIKQGIHRTLLRSRKGGQSSPLSLKDLREQIESDPDQVDDFDIGGCGCFVTE